MYIYYDNDNFDNDAISQFGWFNDEINLFLFVMNGNIDKISIFIEIIVIKLVSLILFLFSLINNDDTVIND